MFKQVFCVCFLKWIEQLKVNIFISSEPPTAKPQNVTVKRTSETSLQVTWDVPRGSKWDDDITYTVEVKSSNSYMARTNYLHHSNCPNLHCSLELNNLVANAQYIVDVASDKNEHFECGRCKAMSSEELHVSWDRPIKISFLYTLKTYKVTYAPSHLFYPEGKIEHTITSANELVLHGLKKNTNYTINVLAMSTDGGGFYSTTFNCSTDEDGTINCDFIR